MGRPGRASWALIRTRHPTVGMFPNAHWPALLLAILVALGACGGSRARAAPRAVPVTGPATTATPPVAAPTTTAAILSCTKQAGSLSYDDVPGANGTIHVAVYQPACAVAAPGRRFPTVYLLHGTGADATQWPAIGLAATADTLIAAGVIAPLIVVMPNSGLNPADTSVVDTILPWADAYLPTSATAPDRSIGGISAGGAAAIRIVARHPDLFSRLGGHSPVANATPAQIDQLAAWRGAVWFDVGQGDVLRGGIEALGANLGARGLHTELHEWPGLHNRAYWRQHVGDYLRFYSSR